MGVFEFVIALVSIFAGTVILCVLTVMAFWMKSKRKNNPMPSKTEEQLLRETFEGLRKMEERINNLETILLDSERKERERL